MYLDVLEKQEKKIVVILCKLERLLPPSFFDIMIHLLVHLPYEAKIGGGYVKNKARPEGCISERYLDSECLTFCSMYMNNVDTIFNKVDRNNEMMDSGGINWNVVEKHVPSTLYDVPVHMEDEVYQEEEPNMNLIVDLNIDHASLTRGNTPLELVDASTFFVGKSSRESRRIHHVMDEDSFSYFPIILITEAKYYGYRCEHQSMIATVASDMHILVRLFSILLHFT
ncbi:hypothetical protein Tco_0021712, partial [Tanacetum coccineum]